MQSAGTRASAALFALAYLLSAFGYEFLTFVLTVRVYQLTGRAADVGVFMAVSFLPRMFSPFYGSLSDRYPRNVLFFAVCLATAMATTLLARQHTLLGLYAIWFIISVLAMAILNLRSAILTQVMSVRYRHQANGLVLIFLNVARLAAPVVGGITAMAWSPAGVLTLCAGIYLCAAAAGLAMRLPDVRSKTAASGVLSHLHEGVSMIWRNPDLMALVFVSFVWRLCFGFQSGLLVVYVVQALGKGPVEFGVLTSALAAGSILGSLAGPLIGKRYPARIVMKAGMAVCFALTGLLGVISSYALAVADVVLASFALYAVAVAVHTARDQVIPADCRGRILGCNTLISAVPALISMLVGGWLADVIGIRAVFAGGGMLALAGLVAFALSPLARRPAMTTP
jgi:MFS transporter, DHA3 family, macrolide efflux protein